MVTCACLRGSCFSGAYLLLPLTSSRRPLRLAQAALHAVRQKLVRTKKDAFASFGNKLQLDSHSRRANTSQAERSILTSEHASVLRYYQVVAKQLKDVEESLERTNEPQKSKELSEKLRQLSAVVGLFRRINDLRKELEGLKDLEKEFSTTGDKEMLALAVEDQQKCEADILALENEVFDLIVPPDPVDCQEILVEVTTGVGGKEAMLFTKEIFDMYLKFAAWKGWQCKVIDYETMDIGGLRHASLNISGRDAGKYLKFESGVHRVQRVPQTERSGRIHTSTMATAVLPLPTEVQVVINSKDIVMKTKRASGPGGQHVNKTESAVQIQHIPSGIIVESQEERSQLLNKETAMKKLRAQLYQIELNKQMSTHHSQRKLQFGTLGRAEKIRTYNYPQDRVTDHRLPLTVHGVQEFLEGRQQLEDVVQKLLEESRTEALLEILESIK